MGWWVGQRCGRKHARLCVCAACVCVWQCARSPVTFPFLLTGTRPRRCEHTSLAVTSPTRGRRIPTLLKLECWHVRVTTLREPRPNNLANSLAQINEPCRQLAPLAGARLTRQRSAGQINRYCVQQFNRVLPLRMARVDNKWQKCPKWPTRQLLSTRYQAGIIAAGVCSATRSALT